jgi:hypothetical protein
VFTVYRKEMRRDEREKATLRAPVERPLVETGSGFDDPTAAVRVVSDAASGR